MRISLLCGTKKSVLQIIANSSQNAAMATIHSNLLAIHCILFSKLPHVLRRGVLFWRVASPAAFNHSSHNGHVQPPIIKTIQKK
jgi:hypothetical protein